MLGNTPKELPMTEQELEAYLDSLYAEYVAKEEAYKFEDNYAPFETKPGAANDK